MNIRIETAAIDCLLLRLFDSIDEANMPWLLAADARVRELFGNALIDLVPSYTTLLVHYDMCKLSSEAARNLLERAAGDLKPQDSASGRCHALAVWYHPSVGPDLRRIAERTGLSVDEVVRRHSEHEYHVFALGFAPGFAFMGLVELCLATPRLSTPRKRVASGSVGIAERQTAVYPMESPGGWNLIGRTPVRLFDRELDGYSLLRPGDRVRFEPVDQEMFLRLGGDDTPMAEAST